jgi:peptidoglycan biosynthesis protein MviN/MurJ (putative lipid II flippase)
MAHEDSRTPARAAVVSFAVNLVAALALVGPLPAGGLPARVVGFQHALVVADMGYAGLALATSIAAATNALYLILASRAHCGQMLDRSAMGRFARLALASVALVAVLWVLGRWLPVPSVASARGLALLGVHVAGGAAAYAAALGLLGSPELEALLSVVRRRRSRR